MGLRIKWEDIEIDYQPSAFEEDWRLVRRSDDNQHSRSLLRSLNSTDILDRYRQQLPLQDRGEFRAKAFWTLPDAMAEAVVGIYGVEIVNVSNSSVGHRTIVTDNSLSREEMINMIERVTRENDEIRNVIEDDHERN